MHQACALKGPVTSPVQCNRDCRVTAGSLARFWTQHSSSPAVSMAVAKQASQVMAAADTVDTHPSSDVLKFLRLDDVPYHPRYVINRPPTPQDLLELSARIYKNSRRLYHEADSQGMRVYHDELIMGDVRLVMLVPSWFPKAHVTFDWERVEGDTVSVVLVIRGTCQDLIGNTKANLQLLFNKLVDDEHLPDVAADATKVIQAWLLELMLRQPQLDAGTASSSSGFVHGPDAFGRPQRQKQPGQKQLHLDVHVTGHSLGGLLAEVATVESHNFAAAHGATWHCTSFESPGLPDLYHTAALRCEPQAHWEDALVSYLAAPNAINMLYEHLGSVVHVVVPWEQTWSHVAKCVGADVARVTAWAIVGGMVLAGMKQLTSPGSASAAGSAAANAVRKQQQEDNAAQQCPAGLGGGLPSLPGLVTQHASQQQQQQQPQPQPGGVGLQNCNAVMPQVIAGIGSVGATAGNAASGVSSSGITNSGVSLGVPTTVAGTAVAGPPVPAVFTVVETASSSGRKLASVGGSIAGVSMAAAANAAAAAAGPTASAAAAAAGAPATVSGTTAGIAAAAGEAVASVSSARILQYVARKSGLGVLANAVGGWLLGRGGLLGVLECLAGVLGVEVEELIAQHALGPMRQCFDPHTGQLKPRYKREMASWPHLGHRRKVLLTAAKQVAKWSVPSFICRDNVGVANIMSRTAMVEARCARLKGYVVKDGQVDAAAYDAALLDDAAAAAAHTNPTLEQLLHVEQGLLRHNTLEQAEICAHMQQQQQLPPAAAEAVQGGVCDHIMAGASTSTAAAASTAMPQLPARSRMHRKMLRPADMQQQQQLVTASGPAAAATDGTEQMQDIESDGFQALVAGAAAMDFNAANECEGLPDARGVGLGVDNDMMDFEEMSQGQASGNRQLAFGGC